MEKAHSGLKNENIIHVVCVCVEGGGWSCRFKGPVKCVGRQVSYFIRTQRMLGRLCFIRNGESASPQREE